MPMIRNCNLEFCQKVRYKKSYLTGLPLSNLVPKQSLLFYKKMLYQSTIRNKNKKKGKQNTDLYHLIAFKLSFGSLEFFSAELKLIQMNEMEKYLVLKLMPNQDGIDQARMMVDKKMMIHGQNSKVVSVLGLPHLRIRDNKTGSKRRVDELIPGIRKVKEFKNGIESAIGLKLNQFSTQVRLNGGNSKKNNKSIQLRAKVDQLDDSDLLLIRLWKVKKELVGAASTMMSLSIPSPRVSTKHLRKNLKKRHSKGGESNLALHNTFSLKPQNINTHLRFEFRVDKTLHFTGSLIETPKIFGYEAQLRPVSSKSLLTVSDFKSNIIPVDESMDPGETPAEIFESMRKTLLLKNSSLDIDNQINYGEGIRTKRLIDGDLRDVYEDEDSMMDSEDEEDSAYQAAGSLFKNRYDLNKRKEKRNKDKSRQILSKNQKEKVAWKMQGKLTESVRYRNNEEKKVIRSITCFQIISIFWTIITIILLLFYSNVDRIQCEGFSQLVKIERNIIFTSNGLQDVYYILTDICLLNEGINILYDTEYRNKMEQKKAESKEYLDELAKKIEEVNNGLESLKPVLPEFNQLMDARRGENVIIKTGQDTRNFTYIQASRHVLSNTHIISKMKLEDINFSNRAVEFTRFNINEDLYTRSVEIVFMTSRIRRNIEEAINLDNKTRIYVFLYLNIAIWMIGYCLIYCANLKREEAVETFYGFNDEYLKVLTKRSEKFVDFLQNEEAKIEDDAGGHIEDFEMTGVDNDSEFTHHGFSQGKGNHLFEKRRLKQTDKGDFLNLKKRKKKGTLAPLISAWQVFWLTLMSLALLASYLRNKSQIEVVSRASMVSGFIFELNVLVGLPIVFRNALVEALIDPTKELRKLPPIFLAVHLSGLQSDYNERLFRVKN